MKARFTFVLAASFAATVFQSKAQEGAAPPQHFAPVPPPAVQAPAAPRAAQQPAPVVQQPRGGFAPLPQRQVVPPRPQTGADRPDLPPSQRGLPLPSPDGIQAPPPTGPGAQTPALGIPFQPVPVPDFAPNSPRLRETIETPQLGVPFRDVPPPVFDIEPDEPADNGDPDNGNSELPRRDEILDRLPPGVPPTFLPVVPPPTTPPQQNPSPAFPTDP